MGCWGYGPFDNDTAGDMASKSMRVIHAVVGAKNDARAQNHYDEARVAVQFALVSHGTDILGGPGLDDPLKALVRMRSDTEWLSGFRQPRKLAKILEGEMGVVLARIVACKGCRRSLNKNEMAELHALVGQAREVRVPKSTRSKPAKRHRR